MARGIDGLATTVVTLAMLLAGCGSADDDGGTAPDGDDAVADEDGDEEQEDGPSSDEDPEAEEPGTDDPEDDLNAGTTAPDDDEGSDDQGDRGDGSDDSSDGDPTASWDADDAIRVTYEYEADFHESDEPATMILARRGNEESLQWDQAGIRAHINPDAAEPFVCTSQADSGWECYSGGQRPDGYQLERSFVGEDEELVDAFREDADATEIADRPALCVEVSIEDFDGTMCADEETGVVLRSEGTTPDGEMSAEAIDVAEPSAEDFEAPAPVESM